jgi:phosphopantetheine--protein transferase-like protein
MKIYDLPDKAKIISNGCDTETTKRFAKALNRHPGFLKRWFTAREISDLESAQDPVLNATIRFTLKEAAIKALWPSITLVPSAIETSFGNDWQVKLLPKDGQFRNRSIELAAQNSIKKNDTRDTDAIVESIVVAYVVD